MRMALSGGDCHLHIGCFAVHCRLDHLLLLISILLSIAGCDPSDDCHGVAVATTVEGRATPRVGLKCPGGLMSYMSICASD